jgi:hypothetical protein
MGTRADFYNGVDNPKWIGSIFNNGQPWNIPAEILIQKNSVMYEELVVDFIESVGGVVQSNGNQWPWPWESSKLTDYSYAYSKGLDLVIAYSMVDKRTFDPLKIVQGDDLTGARIYKSIKFPMMGVGYGPNAAKAV